MTSLGPKEKRFEKIFIMLLLPNYGVEYKHNKYLLTGTTFRNEETRRGRINKYIFYIYFSPIIEFVIVSFPGKSRAFEQRN